MDQDSEKVDLHNHLKGLASQVLQEAIRADLTMHHAQIEAWQWFAKHLQKGELINDDLNDGLPRNLYLALSELSRTLHVRIRSLNTWSRIGLAARILMAKAKGYSAGSVKWRFVRPPTPWPSR